MGYRLLELETLGDNRGSLIAIEEGYNVPFCIKRMYYIYDTKLNVTRGCHAHRNLKQLAICIHGSCDFMIDDGKTKEIIRLNSPKQGLFIEGLIWREMSNFSKDCILVVLANEHYNEFDYIRNYNAFLKAVK